MPQQIRGNLDIRANTVTATEVDATLIVAAGTNAYTANQSMGGFKLTNLGTPTADSDCARMQDVREPSRKKAVRLTTNAALPACTALGSGVGKTLTASVAGILTVDGVAPALGDRILVKNEVAGANNGIYDVTTVGTALILFVLTRSTDADTSAKMVSGTSVFTSEGTAYDNKGFSLITNAPIVLDTTVLEFSQTSGAGQISAGAGLTKTADTIDVISANGAIVVNANDITFAADAIGGANLAKAINISANGAAVKVDNTTVEGDATTGQLKVKAAGITPTQIATSVAGDGIAGGAGTPLSVNTGRDEFTATSDNQTLTLVNTGSSVSGTEDVWLRGLHKPSNSYTLTATTLNFTAGEQLTGDLIEIRALV
ncbi:hypothetical protein KKG24_04650 [Patescibacteria group bacterium]|nr:hypothetical protein [Patescibacteria group bacterium]